MGTPIKIMAPEHLRRLNRTQRLVLGFFVFAWVALIMILAAAPEVYEQLLRLPGSERKVPTLALLTALFAFLVVLGVGVVRRWRWTFWLVLVAFLIGGVLRVPASILQIRGILPSGFPDWYLLLQALIGVVQVVIGILMVVGYRRDGVWGSF